MARKALPGHVFSLAAMLFAAISWPAAAGAARDSREGREAGRHSAPGRCRDAAWPRGLGSKAPATFVVDQVDQAFTPDLTIIPIGSTVTFPNTDKVSHQVYSFSPAKRFQLPLYRGTPYAPTKFETAGIVTLGCNHPRRHDRVPGRHGRRLVPAAPIATAAGAQATCRPASFASKSGTPRLREKTEVIEQRETLGASSRASST